LKHVQRGLRQAQSNSALPFDLLVQRLKPPKDMSRTALFDVLYQFLSDEPYSRPVPNGEISCIDTFLGYGKYDLNLTMRRRGDTVCGHLQFNLKLFHQSFIEDFLSIFETVLQRAQDERIRVAQLVRLPGRLMQRQIELLRAETGVQPQFATLDAAFDAVSRHCPDSTAIVFDGEHFTYKSIAEASRRISRALLHAKVQPGMPVMVFLERSPDAIGAMLGILRTGAYYVPVDPQYPPLRTAMLIEDSGAVYVITSAALGQNLKKHMAGRAIHVIEVEACSSFSAAPLASRSTPEGVAYSIYTSGSTGRPKGCLVQQRNVAQLVLSQGDVFAFSREDVWTWSHSLCFDFSVWEIFGTLLTGARGVLLSEDAVRDPEMVRTAVEQEQVTVLNQTPVAGLRLAEHLLTFAAATPGLRYLIFGGDMLMPKRLEDWLKENQQIAVVNMYGITETTVHVTRKILDPAEIAQNSRSIGRGLPNAVTYILAKDYTLLPMGVLGEIGVTGDGVSLGYWKRPDLTAEKFIPDPFSGRPGTRMYISGDLGRLLPSGEIDFHGRRDNQVKIRGYRIELGEIEKTLLDHPEIAGAALVVRDDALGNRMLVAFVVAREDEIDPNAVRVYLQERLTSGMMPGLIQPLRAMPRNASGKIDRKALAQLALQREENSRSYLPPRDETERILVRIWEEVLGRNPVGIADDFFEIGGDSILGIQICGRAQRAGLALTPKLLFEHTTIRDLSHELNWISPHTVRGKHVREAPLLPAQEWFFAQRHANPDHFNQSAWFTLNDGVSAEDVREAFQFLRQRHVALRLIFVSENGRILQRESETLCELPFTSLQLTGKNKEERSQVAAAAQKLQHSLDVQKGPLFGALLVESASEKPARLLIVLHHLIVDTVSWRILVEELDIFLDHRLRSEPLDLAPAPSLLDYAASLAGRRLAQEQTALGSGPGVPIAIFPENTFENIAEIETDFDEAITCSIAGVLAREKLGWEEALAAAMVYAARAGDDNEVQEIFLEGHGRESSSGTHDPSHTVGWFMKLYRVPVRPMQGPAFSWLQEVRTEIARVKKNPDLLEQWWAQGNNGVESKLLKPGICLNFLGQVDALLRTAKWLGLAEGETSKAIAPGNQRFHLVEVTAFIVHGRLRIRWVYCAVLHKPSLMEKFAADFSSFLRSLAPATGSHSHIEPQRQSNESYPLAPGQLGLLYRALLNSGASPEYVVNLVLKLEGKLDVDLFQRSWAILVQRHEGLRAYFSWDGAEGPTQRFAENVTFPVAVFDWRNLEPAQVESRLQERVREKAKLGFDLSKAPLLSLEIMETDDQERYALLQMHHAIIDGWSLAILRNDLLRIYAGLRSGSAPSLDRAGRFRDYLRFLERQDRKAARDFWKQRLHGVRPCALSKAVAPRAESESVTESLSLEAIHHQLDRTQGLAHWAARNRLTLNTVVQGVWSVVIGSITGRTAVVTGVVVASRPEALSEAETTVGNFINTLPLPVELNISQSLVEWLQELQAGFVAAQQFQYTSLSEMCAAAGLAADQPLFDTVLVCENYLNPKVQALEELTIREVSYAIKEGVPLILEYMPDGVLVCRLRFRPDLVNIAVVREASELLQAAIEMIERRPLLSVPELCSALGEREAARRKERQNQFAADRRNLLREVTVTRDRNATDQPKDIET
jgi:amino acid adenylation domain-containing protein